MGSAKTELEILQYNKLIDLQKIGKKTKVDFDENRIKDTDFTQELIYKVNILDAKTLLDFASLDTKIAPKFKYIYAKDEYNFGIIEHFINNCDMKNLNNITAINNEWHDKWSDLRQIDIVVASQKENIEEIKSALKKLYDKVQNRVYVNLSMGSDFKEEEILMQIKRHITPKNDNIYLVNILKSMGICAKIDFIHRENKRFLSKTGDLFFEKVQMSLKDQSEQEKTDLKKYFDRTHNYKKDTSFIKWGMLSLENRK